VTQTPDVVDNRAASRYEVTVDGHTAVLDYERRSDRLVLVHTEVPPELRGRHLGDALVKAALDAAQADGLRVVPVCPFAKAYMHKHGAHG
jgi:predicted GNAT family acetyltransferase